MQGWGLLVFFLLRGASKEALLGFASMDRGRDGLPAPQKGWEFGKGTRKCIISGQPVSVTCLSWVVARDLLTAQAPREWLGGSMLIKVLRVLREGGSILSILSMPSLRSI